MKLITYLSLFITCCLVASCGTPPRPQDPADRPYPKQEITFTSTDGTKLAGELVLPNGTGPHPAVIFMAGSGPQDRDETVAGHKPFLVISDALAQAGIASLRYDKRGVGDSGGNYETAGLSDFARDGSAALTFLAAQPGINPNRLGIIGHSEGGMTAPMVAKSRSDVQAMVLLAAAAINMEDLQVEQLRDIGRVDGTSETDIETWVTAARATYAALRATPNPSGASDAVRAAVEGFGRAERRVALALYGGKWGWEVARYDARATLAGYRGKTLALYGGSDLQVAASSNAPAMQALLNPNRSQVITLPGHNHLFQPSASGAPSDYAKIETTIAPQVLSQIVSFLQTAL